MVEEVYDRARLLINQSLSPVFLSMNLHASTKPSKQPFFGGEKCYACDCTNVVGYRDRRPEGGINEIACKRHADPWIKVFEACIYCNGPVRNGSLDIDGEFAHKKCHEQVENGTFHSRYVDPK